MDEATQTSSSLHIWGGLEDQLGGRSAGSGMRVASFEIRTSAPTGKLSVSPLIP
jgi:hypothetical protein